MAAYLPREDWQDEEEVRPIAANNRQRENDPHRPARSRSNSRNRRPEETRGRPSTWQYSCGLCQEDHAISSCQRFRDKTPYQRYETVERRGYCRNCLARSHLAPDCPSLTGCRRCELRHHTLLHGAPQLDHSLPRTPIVSIPYKWDLVFVPTAMIRVAADRIDDYAVVRVLISQSAPMTRLAYSTFRRLGWRSFVYQGRRFTTFKIMPRHPNSTWALKVNALITDELPTRLYSDPLLEDPTQNFSEHMLADPDPRSNTPVEIELGADTYSAIRRDGCTFAGVGDVHAHKTIFGYSFSGPIRNLPRE